MNEWWTYRLSDLLLFSDATYGRLFELYHAALWPAQVPVLALGLALLAWVAMSSPRSSSVFPTGSTAVTRPGARSAYAAPAACAALALAWIWIGWGFHLQRYAPINWAAQGFAWGYFVQGGLLGLLAWNGLRRSACGEVHLGLVRSPIGLALLAYGVLLHPLAVLALDRPWTQAELAGLTPDATALATLGLLLCLRQAPATGKLGMGTAWAWAVPLAWCAVSTATLWTLQATGAWLPAAAATGAIAGAVWSRRPPPSKDP